MHDLPATDSGKFTIGGQQIVGVLRGAEHGEPMGTTRVTDLKRSYGAQKVTAATSEDSLSPQELDAQWKYLQKLTKVDTQDSVDDIFRKIVT